jgi:hypothetical protein
MEARLECVVTPRPSVASPAVKMPSDLQYELRRLIWSGSAPRSGSCHHHRGHPAQPATPLRRAVRYRWVFEVGGIDLEHPQATSGHDGLQQGPVIDISRRHQFRKHVSLI